MIILIDFLAKIFLTLILFASSTFAMELTLNQSNKHRGHPLGTNIDPDDCINIDKIDIASTATIKSWL